MADTHFTPFSEDVANISALSDRPNDNEGYTAEALKAIFDAAGLAIKLYLNGTLLPELDIDHEAITALQQAVADIEVGAVGPGGITTDKLGPLAVTTEKISELAVTNGKLDNGAVTEAKINTGAVTETKLGPRAVTGAKIALTAIENEHLGSQVVKQANMDDNSVGTAQIIGGAVTFEKTSGVQKQHGKVSNITLPTMTAGTQVSVNVTGVTAGNTVIVSPVPGSWITWRDCGVRCVGQGEGTLQFISESAVSAQTYANVVILD